MKTCSKCGIEQPLSCFGKDKHTPTGLNRRCKKCCTAESIASYKRNPHTKRNYWLKSQYGITIETFKSMLVEQDNKCAICCEKFKSSADTCVDHCHDTKAVRGLLCNHCNRAIGLFKESLTNLESAQQYLKKHKK